MEASARDACRERHQAHRDGSPHQFSGSSIPDIEAYIGNGKKIAGDVSIKCEPNFNYAIAVQQGADRQNRVIDAIGPETFTYRGLVEAVGEIIGRQRPIVSVPPSVGYAVGRVIGKLVGDEVYKERENQNA